MIYKRVFIKKNEEKEIKQGFPWIFDNEISHIKYREKETDKWRQTSLKDAQIENGSGVEIYSSAGNFLGTGIINRNSKITIRLISHKHANEIFANIKHFWEKRIVRAVNMRKIYYTDGDSYRLIFAEADFIPGFICERYCCTDGDVYLVVQFSAAACDVFREQIIDILKKYCNPKFIYERSDDEQRKKEGLPQSSGWIGKAGYTEITIEENGVKLNIDIVCGQKTGYFLDQKYNRKSAAVFCKGKRVLDAFSHTGSFALNAFRAGAKEVIAAEISAETLKIIEKNILLNGAENVVKTVCIDVFDLLKKYEAEAEKFDVIILDPPAFTKSAKMIEKAYGGYKEINLRAMRLLNKGGILITCSCSYFFDSNTFYSMLMHAAMDSRKRIQILEKRGAGPDHPCALGFSKSEYLKCAICRIF